jgi:hypothetical protein
MFSALKSFNLSSNCGNARNADQTLLLAYAGEVLTCKALTMLSSRDPATPLLYGCGRVCGSLGIGNGGLAIRLQPWTTL